MSAYRFLVTLSLALTALLLNCLNAVEANSGPISTPDQANSGPISNPDQANSGPKSTPPNQDGIFVAGLCLIIYCLFSGGKSQQGRKYRELG
jgi:hypothetical protein